MTWRVLDLFAGAGGFSAGLHVADSAFETVVAVESDTYAAASFEASFGEGVVVAERIEDWLAEGRVPANIDLVVGGPPCQGFSTLGKQDVEDKRNSLWRQYARTILLTSPKYFVIENVAAFQRSVQFEELRAELTDGLLRDYAIAYGVLNSADYGAPQARKRTVVIGHRRDLPDPGLPRRTHSSIEVPGLAPYVTVREAFEGIPTEPDQDAVLGTRTTRFGGRELNGPYAVRELHWSRDYTQLSRDRFATIPPNGNRFDIPEALLAPCWKSHTSGSGDVMGRLYWDRPSVTVRTEFFKPEKGRYLHPEEDRAITHYEAAVLQGFPETHRFVGSRTAIAKQIGNAVPIPLGAAIGRHLSAALRQGPHEWASARRPGVELRGATVGRGSI